MVGWLGPGLATALSITHGWRSALQIPAFFALVLSVFVPYCTWDKPSDVGYEDQLTIFGNFVTPQTNKLNQIH